MPVNPSQTTIKKIAAVAVQEVEMKRLSQEKKMRSRKWISWSVWFLITAVSLFIVYRSGSDTVLDINLVIKMFGIVTIIYILGNVVEKFVLLFASKLADIIGEKLSSFVDMS